MTHKRLKEYVAAALIVLGGLGVGALQAHAAEVTGTLATNGGTITAPSSSAVTPASSGGSVSAPYSTGHSHTTATTYSSGGVESDGSLATSSDYTGVGGGYDPALDSYLASLNSSGSGGASTGISASDAVAYNNTDNPVPSVANTAAAANAGTSTETMLAVFGGLVVVALGGYGVNAYIASRGKGL